jgi:Spy/CpxP family protein refolding chaperone
MNDVRVLLVAAALFATAAVGVAVADSGSDAPTTPATELHGLPGNNPGHGGASANPQGGGQGGGDGIHDIGDVQGGAAGTPADGSQPPACVAHGGLGAANPNCD